MNDEIIKSIYEIKYPGTYMLKVYNEKTKNFVQFGPLFSLSTDGNFYNHDGTGPWIKEDIDGIQRIVDDKNKEKITHYFCRFVEQPYKMY